MKKYYQKNEEVVWLVLCLLAAVPIGLWLAGVIWNMLDAPWVCKRNAVCPTPMIHGLLCVLYVWGWLYVCHYVIIGVRKIKLFKTHKA